MCRSHCAWLRIVKPKPVIMYCCNFSRAHQTLKSMYPELMFKREDRQYWPGYLAQRHLCWLEDVSLPLEARSFNRNKFCLGLTIHGWARQFYWNQALWLRDRNELEWEFCKLSNGAVQWLTFKDENWPFFNSPIQCNTPNRLVTSFDVRSRNLTLIWNGKFEEITVLMEKHVSLTQT